MAYHLEHREPLPSGLRRILDDQLGGAIDALRGVAAGAGDRDEAIHDARKAFKKSRAVLRLAREEIGDGAYRRDNALLRDAGRRLSPLRDAHVLAQTAHELSPRAREAEVSQTAWRRVTRALDERRTAVLAGAFDAEGAAAEVVEEIVALRAGVGALTLERDDFDAVAPGLRRAYRRGRAAFAAALQDTSEEAWHEWRKRVKDLWYHLRILGPVGPLSELESLADRLGDLLGLEHDHAVLAATVAGELGDALPAGPDRDAILGVVEARRAELRREAVPLGRLVYAERPNAFVRRVAAYWAAWRRGS